jgi:alpha-tubulin suppressor-like RCC1 family protein
MYRSWNRKSAVSLGSWVGLTGLALIGTVSCVPGTSDDLQVENRQSALITTNGISLNGISLNGISLNGISLNGISLNGISLNGISLNGISLNGISLNGISLNGISLNGISLNGVSMTADEKAGTRVLMSYMAECALTKDQQVTLLDDDGKPLVLDGLFGLAPEWASGPLSSRGEHLLSACLAARVNAQGKHVRISLRGVGVETTAVERGFYTRHEGAFWGNLFGDNPAIYTCTVEGSGISGRSCTEGECGFQSMGSCADVCSGHDPVDGHYTSCADASYVLSTFLVTTDDIELGTAHGCVLRDGTPWCWGDNAEGQLGDRTRQSRANAQPVFSSLEAEVVELSGGSQHTCARGADGSAWCWGDNSRGQLGLGINKNRKKKPVLVSEIGYDVASIAAGADHTCALTTAGEVWCWGDNIHGQLGIGSSKKLMRSPALVETLSNNVARIAASESSAHTCAMDNAGALWCWGANSDGQLGDNTRKDRKVPVQIASTVDGASFGEVTDACTGALHTCARQADGSVWCWGSNDLGQLGSGAKSQAPVTRPVRVAIEGSVAQGTLSCGANHTCAIDNDGSLQCWGDNSYGQLGNGSMTTLAPAPVVGLNAVPVSVSADADRTCAMLDDDSMWCWGEDADGWFMAQAGVSALPLHGAMFN